MGHRKRKGSFILLNLVTTAVEEAVLVVVLLVILPLFGINIPIWLIVVLIVAWAAWSYVTYRLRVKTIDKMPVVGAEALIGIKCSTTTPLSPMGYVKVGSELWQAYSIEGDINSEVEVVIVEVKGLALQVTLSSDTATSNKHNSSSKSPGNR
jgi:membrane-bound ClpP family serine protease